jgi:hypothetical protein
MSPGAFRPEARIAVFEFIEGFYNPRRRHSSIGYLSPNDYERHVANPGAHQHAAVLAAVKDKPSGRPPSGAVLDRRCARRLHHRAGRDGRMAPPGAEQKNDAKQEGKMPSDHIPRSQALNRPRNWGKSSLTLHPLFCRSLTPGPPPLASMNSIPASSRARRIARSFGAVKEVSFSRSSARRPGALPPGQTVRGAITVWLHTSHSQHD